MDNKQNIDKKKVLVLLDTHALIHRAFHALPPLTSPTGEPVGAVYGVATMLFKILKEFSPDYLAAAFDRPEPTFRHKAYKEYKAQRAAAPDDLIRQFNIVRDMFTAFGVRIYDHAGYEADDIIGTLTHQARAEDKNLTIIIASGDLDTTQLVDGERTVVFTMRKGIADTVIYDEHAVRERFGFAPAYLPDFKGLKGDPSDNIKGVPGVGDKTATMIIQTYGTLEKLYAALSKKKPDSTVFKGKLPDVLSAHKNEAYASRDLARIRSDVPLTFTLSDAVWSGLPSSQQARAFLEWAGFTSLVSRLSFVSESTEKEVVPQVGIEQLSRDFFSCALKEKKVSWVAVGGHVVAAVKDEVWFVETRHVAEYEKQFEGLFLGSISHIAFGGKELLLFLWNAGISQARVDFDVGIAAWVLDPALRAPDITELLVEKIHVRPSSEMLAATRMPQLAAVLEEELEKNKLKRVFFEIEMPLIPVLAYMERCGVCLDKKTLADFSKKLSVRMDEREKRIYELAGTTFNINSPKQLGEVLFVKLGISSDAVRKTGGGARSTRASELTKLRGVHPLIDELLAWREETKLKSTYVDVLPQLADPKTGRIHTTFNQTGTVTGRLSSQNPNMQNIPVRTPLGQEIRRAFVASPGSILMSCDYSQIELRIAAHMSEDRRMIQAFRDNADIHTLTAAAINHVPSGSVTPDMRRAAKAINFGILYGMGAQSLAESLGIPRREADAFIRAYFAEFPGIKTLMEKLKTQAAEQEYVETLFGRRRYFPHMASLGWQARREAERMAINAPIQGSDSDIMKAAMVEIFRKLSPEIERGDIKLLLQVHDELLFEVKEAAVEVARPALREIMEHVCKLTVPLRIDVKQGLNWRDMA